MDRKESGEGRMNQQKNPPRVAVVGTGSGCGKTTVVCALLQAFCNRGLKATSFKCGPDYIDPMFHQKVIGTPSRNLDLFFCGEDTVRYLFCRAAADAEISVIEGVMGMYDGIGPDTQEASSNHLAMVTKTPEILVVNTRGMSLSAAALLSGYAQFAPNQLAGVIFNGSSAGMYSSYAKMAQSLGLQPLGYFPVVPQASVESRHLGLVTAGEIENLKEKMVLLAETAEKTLDLDGILQLAQSTVTLEYKKPAFRHCNRYPCALAWRWTRLSAFIMRIIWNCWKRWAPSWFPFRRCTINLCRRIWTGCIWVAGTRNYMRGCWQKMRRCANRCGRR